MERIEWQFSSILLLMMTGVFWGFFYDLFQSLNRQRRLQVLLDLFFWVASLLVIGPLIFFANWLELRFYVWICLGSGVLIYRLLVFPLISLARQTLFRLDR